MNKRLCTVLVLLPLVCFPVLGQRSRRLANQDQSDPIYKFIKRLPELDRIEILAVGSIPSEKLDELDCKDPKNLCNPPYGPPVKILASTVLVGKAAERISALWRQLEPGNSMGCFVPGYVMRFYSKEERLLETEVCFHCCNASLPNYGLAGICGSKKAITGFEKKVMEVLPYPRVRTETK